MPEPLKDVTPAPSPAVDDNPQPLAPADPEKPLDPAPPKGSQTPDERQQAAFLEERRKRKDLERQIDEKNAELERLKSGHSDLDDDTLSEGEKALRKQIDGLHKRLDQEAESRTLEQLQAKHPVLSDKSEEFEEFRRQYPGVPLAKVANLYLSENGLLNPAPARKGLERTPGGPKTAPASGYTAEELKDLRTNNYRKYERLIEEGKIKPEEIRG